MKKINGLLILCIVFILASCNSCKDSSTKADPSDNMEKSKIDTPAKVSDEKPATNAPVKKDSSGSNEVLTNIDSYLVSTASFDPPAPNSEGINNGQVALQNKLTDASFQKVIIEVSTLLAGGEEYRTDYYTIINVDPGQTKLIKIPNTTRGVKLTSRVVKIKSNELTNGEFIVVGKRS